MSRPALSAEYHWASVTRRFYDFLFPDLNSGCWLWTGNCKKAEFGKVGYGTIGWRKRSTYPAHRLSYEMHIGPIPDGLCVLHKCDVRPCVNPDHLFLGTYKDNAQDRDAKGRGAIPDCNGEKAQWAKLTNSDVIAIRAYTPEKWGDFSLLSQKYGVSPQTICDIRKRRTWRSVP